MPPHIALPKLINYPNSHSFCLKNGIPGPGLMYHKETLTEPNAIIREILMGLQPGTTAAPRLSGTQRCYILGHTTDVNILSWLIRESTQHPKENNSTTNMSLTPQPTIAKDLLILRLSQKHTPDPDRSPPQPILWHPLHNPTE
jgi:hypothetical protein